MGATPIAISTQVKEEMLKVAKEHNYPFSLVSDSERKIGKAFGLLFTITSELSNLYKDRLGIDLAKFHGALNAEVCLPATYVVNSHGIITYAYMDEDFRNRAPIEEVAQAVKRAKFDKK